MSSSKNINYVIILVSIIVLISLLGWHSKTVKELKNKCEIVDIIKSNDKLTLVCDSNLSSNIALHDEGGNSYTIIGFKSNHTIYEYDIIIHYNLKEMKPTSIDLIRNKDFSKNEYQKILKLNNEQLKNKVNQILNNGK